MNVVCLDFETFFDTKNGYTLKKQTTSEYVYDRQFAAHGMAIRSNLRPAQWFDACDIPRALEEFSVASSAVLAHHAHFDGLILARHYGVRPRLWLDTLSMARALLGNHIRAGLDALTKYFDLPAKTVPYRSFDGCQWNNLAPDVRSEIAAGACRDVDLTWELFGRHLAPYFPSCEYPIIDLTVRMFTEPVLRADASKVEHVLQSEQSRKVELLRAIGVEDPKELRSPEVFAGKLRELGVEPELKQGKNKPIFAFAATDAFLRDLLDDADEAVSALAEARLAVQSSIEETRAARLLRMSKRGALPIYLNYCGAATTRWSGGDKMNWQNLTPALQECIGLPGFVVDASQIECRLLNYMAGQKDVVERFRSGADPYTAVASEFYGREITKENQVERQVGKVLELQCGYGSGAEKIQHTLKIKAGIDLSLADAYRARDAYRTTHPRVVRYWHEAETVLHWLERGLITWWGPMRVEDGCLWLPNGLPLIYDTLKREDGEWTLERRHGRAKIYGAKLVENVIQALARVYISEVMRRIADAGLRIALMRHDDLVIVAESDKERKEAYAWVANEMRKPPAWAQDIPLNCGGHVGGFLK